VKNQEIGTNVVNVGNSISTVTGAALGVAGVFCPALLIPATVFGVSGTVTGIGTSITNGVVDWNTRKKLNQMIDEEKETLDSIFAVMKSIEELRQALENALVDANSNLAIEPFDPLSIAVLCYDSSSFFGIEELRKLLHKEIEYFRAGGRAAERATERAAGRAGGIAGGRAVGRAIGRGSGPFPPALRLGEIYKLINGVFGYVFEEVAGVVANVAGGAGRAIEAGARAGARAGSRATGRAVGRAIGTNILGPIISVGFTIEHFINGNPMREEIQKQIQSFESLQQISTVFTAL